LTAVGRLLSESEWTEIQRLRLALARERFEFRSSKAALEQLSKLEEMDQEDMEREEARVQAIKLRLFGKDCSE